MGLRLSLDAHLDLVDTYSLDSQYNSFTALVLPSEDFPLINLNSFRLIRGAHNLVALTSKIFTSDDSLRTINASSRGCLFSDEVNLKLFRNYTQSKCIFECMLSNAQEEARVVRKSNRTCTPWYFPFAEGDQYTCDPWETMEVYKSMMGQTARGVCEYCMPSCNFFTYQPRVSHEPFRMCDDLNLGSLPFCNFGLLNTNSRPLMWGSEINEQFKLLKSAGNFSEIPSTMRTVKKLFGSASVPYFENTYRTYNPFTEDISVVSVYFDQATAWEFTTQASSTWLQYLSNVGGLMGLFVGLSLVSIIELFWLIIRIISIPFSTQQDPF